MRRSTRPPTLFPHVTKTLRPHQPGTLKLTHRYGDALVCVRYREDGPGRRRCTTVELVIDEGPVQRRVSDRKMIWVTIAWKAHELRARAMALGALWDPTTKKWRMSMRTARALGLETPLATLAQQEVATHRKVK